MDAPQGGFVLSGRQPFLKQPISVAAQIELFRSRGLQIDDSAKAEHYLKYIGYYRLGGYAGHFRAAPNKSSNQFADRTSFRDILDLYIFDRKIRVLLFDAMERVEVAVKAVMSYVGLLDGGGPFWLTDANNFDYGTHNKVIEEIKVVLGETPADNRQHIFISHFYAKYSDPYPPSWMLMECLSFGAVSRIYKVLKGRLRVNISKQFNLQQDVMESWLHAISHCRNVVAHHSQCWKRVFTIRPKISKAYRSDIPETSENKLYAQCWMLNHFMHIIADGSKWAERVRTTIAEKPKTVLADMGFRIIGTKSVFGIRNLWTSSSAQWL